MSQRFKLGHPLRALEVDVPAHSEQAWNITAHQGDEQNRTNICVDDRYEDQTAGICQRSLRDELRAGEVGVVLANRKQPLSSHRDLSTYLQQ